MTLGHLDWPLVARDYDCCNPKQALQNNVCYFFPFCQRHQEASHCSTAELVESKSIALLVFDYRNVGASLSSMPCRRPFSLNHHTAAQLAKQKSEAKSEGDKKNDDYSS